MTCIEEERVSTSVVKCILGSDLASTRLKGQPKTKVWIATKCCMSFVVKGPAKPKEQRSKSSDIDGVFLLLINL